jgi:hypothetical protein
VAVRGAKARRLLLQLLDGVATALPADVTVHVSGSGRRCILTAQRAYQHAANVPPAGPVRLATVTKLRAPLGIGPWVPFLPRRLAARRTAIAALEMIQDVVSTAHGWPWPDLGFDVHAADDGNGVSVWFEDASGKIISAGHVSLVDAT